MGRSDSDMFHDLSRVALTDGPQVFEGVDAGTVAVAPADGDGIVADARDHAWSYVRWHTLRIQKRTPACRLDACGTVAVQPEAPDIEVVPGPILPEHGQRPRTSRAD